MLLKTFGNGFRFVLILGFLLPAATNLWSKAPGRAKGDARKTARVTISVYNDAEVPSDLVAQAEKQAEHVFQRAGIEVYWLNCRIPAASEEGSQACREAVFPEHLHLRIVRASLGLKAEAMGVSFQAEDGSGCYADLFYEPMQQLHKSDGTDIASLLGHVAAHEIGHLLLGRNSHSPAGIMQARWTTDELTSENAGRLVFLEKESRRMRAKLGAALQGSRGDSNETFGEAPKEEQSPSAAEAPARTGD